MPIVLQLHLFMMSKYSKFGADAFDIFWATLKFLHEDDNDDNQLLNFFFEIDKLKNDQCALIL